MLDKFIQYYTPLIKTYNKKKGKEETVYDTSSLQKLVDRVNKLCLFDVLYQDNRELHTRLLGFIDGFVSISSKKKLKDKYLTLFLEDIWYLNYVYEDNQELLENELDNEPDIEIYNNPIYARKCADKYVSLLLSKSIDYIDPKENVNKLGPTIDLFDVFKDQLHRLIEAGLLYWVYPFTENLYYVPINLRYLDAYKNLGTRITEWVDGYQEHKLAKYLRGRGYDVFAGWGVNLLQGEWDKQITGNSKPVSNKDNTELKEVVLSSAVLSEIVGNVYNHMQMYMKNKKFNLKLEAHLELVIRTIAVCISHKVYKAVLKHGTYLTILRSVKSLYSNKSYYNRRVDRKYWFKDEWVNVIKSAHMVFSKNRAEEAASVVAIHAYDTALPPENSKPEDILKYLETHHDFVARSHDIVYHDKVPFTDEEIKHALDLYQNRLTPVYKDLVSTDNQWIIRATLELWLNIRDGKRVDVVEKQLREWFTNRHPTDLNTKYLDQNKPYFLLMSYHNKKTLLDRLRENPIDVVNYGKSLEVYEELIEICRKDVENPIKNHSIERVETSI